jgi:adenylate cyclase
MSSGDLSREESIDALVDWLVDGAPGAAGAPEVVARCGRDLREAGVSVDRMAAFVTTLHPSVAGRSFRWSPDGGIAVGEISYDIVRSEGFTKSPMIVVVSTGAEVRARLDGKDRVHAYPVYAEFAAAGFVEHIALPLKFINGEVHVVTFTTKNPNGFSEADIADMRRVLRPLSRLGEILALRRTASTLLSTYVGRNSGDKILAGRIHKGDFETVRAVIWFSDLRGFTEMSSRLSTREVIDNLNRVFECQVPAIVKGGGEVLKFMGDGLLAIFPLADGDDTSMVADRALDAAEEALAAVAALPPLRIGVALHVGELAYGNIGGSNRLDFTAIGPAVNLAARLEGLTSKLGKPLVVSAEIARLTTRATDDLGPFDLKGVPEAVHVHAPRA